jgi:endonuclease/exonuclease/phosphatase family metal-dependent hydrolase
VYLRTNDAFDFILLNNHLQPGAVDNEIRVLPHVADYYRELWNDPDVMIVGDLNADGNYFDETLLDSIFPESEYNIIITDDYDTTLAQSENTYDRFIISSTVAAHFTGNFGVIRFDEVYDFSALSIAPRAVSDHYPVWAEFLTEITPSEIQPESGW